MMNFVFTGFFQDGVYRVFSYEAVPRDPTGQYWVRVDMTLARQHHISVQELPLLCGAFLGEEDTVPGVHTVTFTGAALARLANQRAQDEKKRPRRPFRPNRAEAVKV